MIDWLVITAANKAQARGYRSQLSARESDGRLAGCRHWMVVPDPGDRRVGSGGSTLVVLYELARRLARGGSARGGRARSLASLFRGQRILIIHSGGDSRRLPAYAAEGKVFAPLPMGSARGAALFDMVLADLRGIRMPDEGRVVVATGDVYLGIGHPDISRPGIVGVAFPGTVEQGGRHGVYVRGKGDVVAGFLQKPNRATAKRRGAIDAQGRVLIDTGVLSLDAERVARWMDASGLRVSKGHVAVGDGTLRNILSGRLGPIDLYDHVLTAAAMKGETRFVRAFGDSSGPEFTRALKSIYRGVGGVPFHVSVVPRCDFLHIGSSRELLSIITRDPRVRNERADPTRPTVFNSVVTAPIRGGRGSVVEASRIDRPLRLEGDNIVVGAPGGAGITLRRGHGLVFLPIGRLEWACVGFGKDDDFKTSWDRGGTFGGMPIEMLLSKWRVTADELFDSDASLWAARLWRVGAAREVLGDALSLLGAARMTARWRTSRRWGLRDLIARVNHARLIGHRQRLRHADAMRIALRGIAGGAEPKAADLQALTPTRTEADVLLGAIGARLKEPAPPFSRARLYRSASVLTPAGTTAEALDRAAFECIAQGVAQEIEFPRSPPRAAIKPDQVVWVTSPVRIDLAGGWSDTPPICHEMGGSVVNVAITLNGQYPVQAMARLTEEPRIRLSSVDLGCGVEYSTTRQASAFDDPHDWAALAKAALSLAGIVPRDPRADLGRALARFGGGLDLTMFAALPKGSGLGTSSILGATILACLDRVCGRDIDVSSLIRRTSLLEQMMSTAGGWQDQVGGITPGIKLLRTSAGADQVPELFGIVPPERAMEELRARSMLYYTGQRRLARDILHGVLRRYLSGDAGAIDIIHQLKAAAENMRADLMRGDIDAFARGVLRNWTLKKAIDPGSTNDRIERVLGPLAPHLVGYELPGAGGGGFIYMIAKTVRDAAAVRSLLERRPPNRLARFYDYTIDDKGLAVSVL